MEYERMISALFLFVVVLCFHLGPVYPESVEKCLDGKYHKETPSPEGPEYADCFSWKKKSCCNAEFTKELKKSHVENLWNFTWNHCGNLSQDCERYIKDEECFFQCEPNLIKWRTGQAAVKRVPICHTFCNDWFKACENDMTCVTNWSGDFNFTSNSYVCPLLSKCQTFRERYGNGEGLCNKMWGSSFKYETTSNCMLMRFDSTQGNPNDKVYKPVQSGTIVSPHLVMFLMGFGALYYFVS